MMSNFFDVIAVIAGILLFIFIMALDSPTMAPLYICLICGVYLLIYSLIKASSLDELSEDLED